MRDLLIDIDAGVDAEDRGGRAGPSGAGLSARLTARLREAVRDGRLAAGTRMPSSRALAADLGVSRGVVVEAYTQLIAEGYLTARHGSGTRVGNDIELTRQRDGDADHDATTARPTTGARGTGAPRTDRDPADRNPADMGDGSENEFELRPGAPDQSLFPRQAWLAALRDVIATVPNTRLGYGDPCGTPELRRELADYLGRARGVATEAARVLVVSGVAQGEALISSALAARGHRLLAVEDPGSASHRELLTSPGIELIGVPVDEEGIDVDALAATPARAVLVTPAHQYPTGVVLSPRRRAALVRWAHARDAIIIEDDYDAELRYDRAAVGALQALAPEVVVHLGSVSKALAPALRLGWAVVPQRLLPELTRIRDAVDLGCPTLDQLALARLISAGGYDRQLRLARRAYRARRAAFVSALRQRAPDVRIHGIAAGVHALVELPASVTEAAVVDGAARRGVRVAAVGPTRLGAAGPPMIVIAYGALTHARLHEAVERLAAAIDAARR